MKGFVVRAPASRPSECHRRGRNGPLCPPSIYKPNLVREFLIRRSRPFFGTPRRLCPKKPSNSYTLYESFSFFFFPIWLRHRSPPFFPSPGAKISLGDPFAIPQKFGNDIKRLLPLHHRERQRKAHSSRMEAYFPRTPLIKVEVDPLYPLFPRSYARRNTRESLLNITNLVRLPLLVILEDV